MTAELLQEWHDTLWWFTRVVPVWTSNMMSRSMEELAESNMPQVEKRWNRYRDYP